MTDKRENRRVQMTKRLMKDALMELLEEHELVNISVTAICEAADVHRSTFYKYYKDQSELLRDLEQSYLDQVPTPFGDADQLDEEQILAQSTAFFDFVKRNKGAFRVLLGESTSSDFAARLIDLLCSGLSSDSDDPSTRYANLYIANGTVGLLREWVCADFPISSSELAQMMFQFSVKVTQ